MPAHFLLLCCAGAHLTRMTQDHVLTNPTDAIPAGNYTVVLTAIDVHGSRTSTTSSLTVLPCPAPASNRPPTAQLTGAPYTLAVCNGVGSMTLDASGSSDPDAGDSIARYVWEVSSSDFELKLNGPTPTVGAANGLFAGNVYEVEVYVSDTYGAVGVAETTLTGEYLCVWWWSGLWCMRCICRIQRSTSAAAGVLTVAQAS